MGGRETLVELSTRDEKQQDAQREDMATADEIDAVCNLAKFANTKKSRWINFIVCLHDPENDKEFYFNKIQMDLRGTDSKMIVRDQISRQVLAAKIIGIIEKTMEPRGPRDRDQIIPTDSGKAILRLLCTHSKGGDDIVSENEIVLIRALLEKFYLKILDPISRIDYSGVKDLIFEISHNSTPKTTFT